MAINKSKSNTPASQEPGHFPGGSYDEKGTLGLESYSGFVAKAYHADLYWPGVFPIYNRLRRSDPEVTIVRQIFSTIAASVKIEFELPEKPSDDDKRFQDFGNSVLADMEGGIARWRDTLVSYTPFMGWGWWEAVPGLRQRGWRPPDPDDDWRSKFNDGRVGFRRLAFRDHSTFDGWDLTERTGKLKGMWQNDMPNPRVRLPLKRSLHITFGDADNPEGLTPLEALWRLERIKYGLEVEQGIGYEHTAGHLKITKTEQGELTDGDKANIKKAARSILTAQEGNYMALPYGFDGDIVDVNFSAASAILSAIQHYSTLKLALFNMQWVAMSTTSGTGSYAALKDSTALWLVAFNSGMSGYVEQADQQIGERLYQMNRLSFPGITQRPKMKASKVEKLLDLQELGEFMNTIKDVIPLGDDDYIEVRKRSGFLPESLPTNPASTPGSTPTSANQAAEATAKPGEMAQGAHSGVMVALYPPADVARGLVMDGGEPIEELHLTLAYLGDAEDLNEAARSRLHEIVEGVALINPPLAGNITGATKFLGGEKVPLVALLDVPGLPAWRERLLTALTLNGLTCSDEHGFIPHITLAYDSAQDGDHVNPSRVEFNEVWVVIGDEREAFPLKGEIRVPATEEMAAHLKAARDSVEQIHSHYIELKASGYDGLMPERRWLFTELATAFDSDRTDYRETIYLSVLSYLVQDGARSNEFKNKIKRAIVERFPPAFYEAYVSGGGGDVDRDDDAWLTAKINAELGYVDLMFESLRGLKAERVPPSIYDQAANERADGYVRTLEAVFTEGRLRGAKNKMLTMDGDDGEESCVDCLRRKGKRMSAKTWLSRGWVPGIPGNEKYKCRGYKCRHFLQDDDGVRWS